MAPRQLPQQFLFFPLVLLFVSSSSLCCSVFFSLLPFFSATSPHAVFGFSPRTCSSLSEKLAIPRRRLSWSWFPFLRPHGSCNYAIVGTELASWASTVIVVGRRREFRRCRRFDHLPQGIPLILPHPVRIIPPNRYLGFWIGCEFVVPFYADVRKLVSSFSLTVLDPSFLLSILMVCSLVIVWWVLYVCNFVRWHCVV